MPKKLVRGLAALALGFVALFALRMAYGYATVREGDGAGTARTDLDFSFTRKNYASERLTKGTGVPQQASSPAPSDQKYEKIASISSRTSAFAADEARLRALVSAHGGVVQFENSSGLDGARVLQIAAGVPPASFDAMVAAARGLGQLGSIRVDKTDKTNEYKELRAQKDSLEKSRAAYVEMKKLAGTKIDEQMNLEAKILELEQQVQKLGISMGEFDEENELCTVKITLAERTLVPGPSFVHRATVAFAWTVKTYAVLLAGLAFVTIGLLALFAALERLTKMLATPTAPGR
jgi:hypothetical protein